MISAISRRAALLPTVSIFQAAWNTSRRHWSIMMRLLAMRSMVTPWSASGLPNGWRSSERLHIISERALGQADGAHAVMDAPWPKPTLRDLEPAALAEQDGAGRHPHVLEADLGMAMRCVVEAEHGQHAVDGDARRIARDQDHGLLAVLVHVRRVGLAHDDEHGAARVTGAGGPPFTAVDDVVVALTLDPGLDVGRVGRGDGRLRHAEGRADLALQQRVEPAALLLVRAIELERFHVAGVGRGAVEHLARPLHPAHDLGERCVFEVGQPGAALAVGQEQVPQPLVLGLLLQLLHDRHRLPAVGRAGELAVVGGLVGIDVLVHERFDARRAAPAPSP